MLTGLLFLAGAVAGYGLSVYGLGRLVLWLWERLIKQEKGSLDNEHETPR